MRYAQIRSMDISNGEGVGVSSSFKDVTGIVSIVSILKHGILMVEKSGQRKQKINLWN